MMYEESIVQREEVIYWLRERESRHLEELFTRADATRRESVGDDVHLRGLVEFSNICGRACLYCGLRSGNSKISRYRMRPAEIVQAAIEIKRLNLGTIVLQSGEDPNIDISGMVKVIQTIKSETDLAITLSLGELNYQDLEQLRDAGADRYLLRFETSRKDIFDRIHPSPGKDSPDRFEVINWLQDLGYETGSGILIGLPGQKIVDIADDILLFRDLNLDMIGTGPFIPHPDTPLGREVNEKLPMDADLQLNSQQMALKVVALTRLVCPTINIPSTTALESLTPESGYETGLNCGANIVMPNFTPMEYRKNYEIYPAKACLTQPADILVSRLKENLTRLGRHIGTGRGNSRNFTERTENLSVEVN